MEAIEVSNQSIANSSDHAFNVFNYTTSFDRNDKGNMSDVWVSIVLILMSLSCVGCVCSCLLYYKFQKWKVTDDPEESEGNPDLERRPSKEMPPSYTLVTGLPTYEQAVELAGKSPAGRSRQSIRSHQSISSNAHRINTNTMSLPPPPEDELLQVSIISSSGISGNTIKGEYPNAPLTPPDLSPASVRAPTGSTNIRPTSDDDALAAVQQIKL